MFQKEKWASIKENGSGYEEAPYIIIEGDRKEITAKVYIKKCLLP
ncbi:hypothetical protein [Bartonella schoenbuchensis]|nr:hypothetical protein [Bartonella schoenbuchensis]